jgi:hypothetical protein
MLANFQTNRMILAIFIGLERPMMDFFFGKNHHHLGIRLFDWCVNSHTWPGKHFGQFLSKGVGPLPKKKLKFFG